MLKVNNLLMPHTSHAVICSCTPAYAQFTGSTPTLNGIGTASGTFSNMFDGDTGTNAWTWDSGTTGNIVWDFGSGASYRATGFRLFGETGNNNVTWDFDGSQNNSDWDNLHNGDIRGEACFLSIIS